MKIVLLGYMGSGKTTIGKLLAKLLSYEFIDLDEYIEEKEGMKISDVFQSKGEIYFRIQEGNYLKELLNSNSNVVLSLGGGTPCYGNNMKNIINSAAKSFYLKASLNTLVERLQVHRDKRPMIAHLSNDELNEFIGKHLFERVSYYQQANWKITIDGKSANQVVDELKMRLH